MNVIMVENLVKKVWLFPPAGLLMTGCLFVNPLHAVITQRYIAPSYGACGRTISSQLTDWSDECIPYEAPPFETPARAVH